MADQDQTPTAEPTPTSAPAPAPADAPAAEEKPAKKTAAKKTTTKKAPAKKTAAKKTTAGATAKKATTKKVVDAEAPAADQSADQSAGQSAEEKPVKKTAAKTTAKKAAAKTTAKKTAAKKTAAKKTAANTTASPEGEDSASERPADQAAEQDVEKPAKKAAAKTTAKKSTAKKTAAKKSVDVSSEDAAKDGKKDAANDSAGKGSGKDSADSGESGESGEGGEGGESGEGGQRRRRRRGGRRRRKPGGGENADTSEDAEDSSDDGHDGTDASDGEEATSGSRRRRRRRNENAGDGKPRSPEDEITAVSGSTRLEAKKQRRREGREAGRRRAPIVSEAEFLARRESVERVMVVRQREELTQIGVLEDKVLVEHYVARESQASMIGNIYIGRVQNVLPSMEAAFIDIGKGRNAVLYAGEVNWSALGHKDGNPRKIESVLSSGQTVLVQVTKDPIGQKGARLTSQISLAGRFLVYVPDGTTSGISRKLPDTERTRLKNLLKEIVPASAGVIVRTAAEGAAEEELRRDVERLTARWEDIEAKAKSGGGPKLLYGEPDLTLKVVRDLFTEDFAKLVVQGQDAWETVQPYVAHVAPDLEERLEKYQPADHNDVDLFHAYRVDEQIAKALDRKVWLPSGGSLIIDRTEAMTVVDVNTGKFTGSGGNLEETVTKNNLEAAEEVVRQLRLRDIGGIIVVDFIDMVLESNRDLVLRRLVECLGRDRTRHQVAEVTSLGLVQMTRKRIGTGLLEAFSENCEHCAGRGLLVHDLPVEPKKSSSDDDGRRGRRRGGRSRGAGEGTEGGSGRSGASSGGGGGGKGGKGGNGGKSEPKAEASAVHKPSPAEFAAMAKAEPKDEAAEPNAEGAEETRAEPAAEERAVESAPAEKSTRAEPAAEEPAAESAPAEEPTRAEPAAEEPAAEAESVDTGPKLITRTRRGVSRTVATPAPAPVEISAVTAPVPVAANNEAPKVTVTTRTRGAKAPTEADADG